MKHISLLFSAIWLMTANPSHAQQPIKGYVDLHAHMFGHLAYNGQWVTPSLNTPTQKPIWSNIQKQAMHTAWLRKAHRDGLQIVVASLVNFEPLCNILDVARQHKSDPKTKRALSKRAWNKANKLADRCSDMTSVWKQIAAAKAYAKQHHKWLAIVTSPAQARRVIKQGKLAIVLHIEVSNLMNKRHGPWRAQLQKLHKAGIRSMQLVHELNNRFGGAQLHAAPFKIFESLKSHKRYGDSSQKGLFGGFHKDAEGHNLLGLTNEGKQLVKALMAKHMLIDVAHLSMKGIAQTFQLAKANRYYPLFLSHTWIKELTLAKLTRKGEDPKQKKKLQGLHNVNSRKQFDQIMQTGGMIGLRAGPKEVRGFLPTNRKKAVQNNCHGSSRSFAQMYNYTHHGLGANAAIASDLNGFIEMTVPRFGSYACGGHYLSKCETHKHSPALPLLKRLGLKWNSLLSLAARFKKKGRMCRALRQEMKFQQKQQKARTHTEFDTTGFPHIGNIASLVADLKRVGADTRNLELSAEHFIQMWERAHSNTRRNTPVKRANPRPGTILPVPGIDARLQIPTDTCPAKRKRIGLHKHAAICQAKWPHRTIKRKRCTKWGGITNIKKGYCCKRKEGWLLARKLK